MVPPVRCYTCGTVVGSSYKPFECRTQNVSAKSELDRLNLTRICCRRMLISHPTLLDNMCLAHDEKMRKASVTMHTTVSGSRTITLPFRSDRSSTTLQVMHPFRGSARTVLYRFRYEELSALLLLADHLNNKKEIDMAWSEPPHPLSPAIDLVVTFLEAVDNLPDATAFVNKCLGEVCQNSSLIIKSMRHAPDNPAAPCCASVVIPNGSYYLANSLRRIALSTVPAWAAKSVTITENTSVYSDNSIAERLSLIPFRCTIDVDTDRVQPNGEVSPVLPNGLDTRSPAAISDDIRPEMGETLEVTIDVTNTHSVKYMWIHSSDLVMGRGLECCDLNIPLLRLKPGQRFAATIFVDESSGHSHGRYGCVVESGYVERCVCQSDALEMHKLKQSGRDAELIRAIRGDVDISKDGTSLVWSPSMPEFEPTLTMEHSMHWRTTEQRFRITPNRPLFTLQPDPSWIHLFIETDGRHTGRHVMNKVLELFQQTLEDLSTCLANISEIVHLQDDTVDLAES